MRGSVYRAAAHVTSMTTTIGMDPTRRDDVDEAVEAAAWALAESEGFEIGNLDFGWDNEGISKLTAAFEDFCRDAGDLLTEFTPTEAGQLWVGSRNDRNDSFLFDIRQASYQLHHLARREAALIIDVAEEADDDTGMQNAVIFAPKRELAYSVGG